MGLRAHLPDSQAFRVFFALTKAACFGAGVPQSRLAVPVCRTSAKSSRPPIFPNSKHRLRLLLQECGPFTFRHAAVAVSLCHGHSREGRFRFRFGLRPSGRSTYPPQALGQGFERGSSQSIGNRRQKLPACYQADKAPPWP